LEVVKHLIEKGAEMEAKTINGSAPLYLAFQNGHSEVVEHLIKNGAILSQETCCVS
jgi:ankyrin repeat protein